MAGGEGTRLRPLTSNQPKPMVPIVGKPCMEHIVELLREHGFDEIVVTLAFMPQAIRSYFGSGDAQGVSIQYSIEESPAGTAGSVKLAEAAFEEAFLVISGDALCDIDLGALVRFHQERQGLVTVALKSVENPLEFGIVVTDESGRIERFLEKPSWGQVFTDTINTGVYVLDPSVLRHVPTDRPFDFAKELFPLLLQMGKPLYGMVVDAYWQDIGNLDQFRKANFDALDGSVRLNVPGVRLRGNIWLGEGAEVHDLSDIEGPAFVGNYARILPGATVGPYSVLGSSVTLREHARTVRSVVDNASSIGRSALVEGATIGRSCDLRAHARIQEGVVVGDQCTIGQQAVIMPGVRIYPYKEVESGALVDRNLIWESRAVSSLFGHDGIAGLINVDLTPEVALRLGTSLGTALKRGARVVTSRSASPACRLIRRAILAGINSAGVYVADLQVMPASINRHLLKNEGYDAGLHVRQSPMDPEVVELQIFEPPGAQSSPAFLREIEKNYTRQEFRRVAWNQVGEISFPGRALESYRQDLLSVLDVAAIRSRRFRVVVDYAYSSASLVLPVILDALEVEAVNSHAYASERRFAPTHLPPDEPLAQAKHLVSAVGADLGVVLDESAERLYLIDEHAQEVAVEQELLLFLDLLASDGGNGKLALPATVTRAADRIVEGSRLELERTQVSVAALTRAATTPGVIFAGSVGGGFIFPDFLPGYDAVASFCKLLELLAPLEQPLSQLVASLPASRVVHREIRCPWARKGTVMRILSEHFKGREVDVLDGIKVQDERGWVQVLPDADEPVVHLYVEGEDEGAEESLEQELIELIEAAVDSEAELR